MNQAIDTKNIEVARPKRKMNRIILVEAILIILTILVTFRDIIGLYTSEYSKTLQDIVIVVFFFAVIIKNRRHLKIDRSDIILILFAAISIFTAFLNNCDILNYIFQLRNILIVYLLYFSLKNSNLKINYKKVIYIFCIIAIFLTVFSAIEIIFNKKVLFPAAWADNITYADNFKRAYSLLNNPNIYAAFTVLSYILIDSCTPKTRNERILAYIILGAATMSIGLSASRSGAIIFIFYLFYKIIKNIQSKKMPQLTIFKILVTILLSVSLISIINFARNIVNTPKVEAMSIPKHAVLVASTAEITYVTTEQDLENQNSYFIDRFINLFSDETFDNSATDGRLQHIEKAIEIFRDHPILGTGLGTFGSSGSLRNVPLIYDRYDIKQGFYADNEYIVILVETGLVGLILFIFFLVCFIKENQKYTNSLITIVLLLILGLFYNILEIFPLMFLAVIILSTARSQATKTCNLSQHIV